MAKMIVKTEKKDKVELELVQRDDHVELIAVGLDGARWNIIELNNDGRIRLCSNVGDTSGFQVDGNGYVKLFKD